MVVSINKRVGHFRTHWPLNVLNVRRGNMIVFCSPLHLHGMHDIINAKTTEM